MVKIYCNLDEDKIEIFKNKELTLIFKNVSMIQPVNLLYEILNIVANDKNIILSKKYNMVNENEFIVAEWE
jgi:hypothetical protein